MCEKDLSIRRNKSSISYTYLYDLNNATNTVRSANNLCHKLIAKIVNAAGRDPKTYLFHIKKLEKALGERRYLRQGKAIRQVASPSSVCQRFPYAPFNAMVTKISK